MAAARQAWRLHFRTLFRLRICVAAAPIQVENKRGGCTTSVAAAPPDPIQVEDKRGGCTISVAAALPNPIQVEDKRGGSAHSVWG